MQKKAILKVLMWVLAVVVEEILTRTRFKSLAGQGLKWLRDFVIDTETKVDDRIALPIIDKVSVEFDIPIPE